MSRRIDGRRLRSHRTHERLVGAYLDLVAETGRVPTCNEVARRAGCSVRTLFDRFRDMAELSRAAIERVAALDDGIGPVSSASLDRAARIRLHVTARARLCERQLPGPAGAGERRCDGGDSDGRRADEGDLWGLAELETIYDRELSALDAEARRKLLIVLGTLTDVDGWLRIRQRFGTSISEACEVWQVAIDRLLPPTPG